MRRLELILVFASAFAVLWPVVFGVRPRRGIVAGVLVVAFVAQLQIEGYRWQMVPLYGVALGLALGDVLFIDRTLSWTSRLSRGVFGLAGLTLAAALPLALPVPEIPPPPGPEAIGAVTVHLVDVSREEIYGPDPGGPRRFRAHVWYPAEASSGVAPAPWVTDWDVVVPALARSMGLPGWFLDHTRYTDSHARRSLPVAPGTFPVVVYSHRWSGLGSIAVNQVEALVSNGYVVIAPDHTYGAVATIGNEGEVVPLDPAALPDRGEVGDAVHLEAAAELVDVFAGDIVTILDGLEEGEEGPFGAIAEVADLTRIGVYGHSVGGGAAIQLCLTDERCDAVLGMDPWVEPFSVRTLRISATRPALFMRSDGWRGTPNDSLLRGIAGRSEAVTYWLGIEGAGHNDFTVAPFFSPFGYQMGLKGPIPTGRLTPIVDNYLVGFFDVFLLGTGTAPLDSVDFPEVALEVVSP
ncbi:MAG: dienelactone hydrolase family protein [Actinobacteria bacterium]|nr:dienelactone hydrolase family protein [Actinomycetota bacterium]